MKIFLTDFSNWYIGDFWIHDCKKDAFFTCIKYGIKCIRDEDEEDIFKMEKNRNNRHLILKIFTSKQLSSYRGKLFKNENVNSTNEVYVKLYSCSCGAPFDEFYDYTEHYQEKKEFIKKFNPAGFSYYTALYSDLIFFRLQA